MKGFKTLLGLGLLTVSMAWVLLPGVAESVIPERINIQGILKDAGGNPVADGVYSVIFTIYNADIGGTVFWAETTSVTTAGGLFNYRMGAANAIPDTAIRLNTWLGIKVGADPEMTPRSRLTSVSHAFKVSTVTGASGGVVTGDIYLQGAGADDYLGLVSSDPNVALDLRSGTSGGDPYIDFSNDAASDYDARIQLQGNDGLQITVPSILSVPTGKVGIGTDAPGSLPGILQNSRLEIADANGLNSDLSLRVSGGGATGSASLNFAKSRGTLPSPTTVQAGDLLGNITFVGHDGADFASIAAWIRASVDGTPGVDDMPGRLEFLTTPASSATPLTRMTIDNAGNVGIGTTSPAQKLDVSGTAQMTGFQMPTGAANGFVLTSDAGGVGSWQAAGGSGGWTDDGAVVRLSTSGDAVGIGTASPAKKLDVAGSVKADTVFSNVLSSNSPLSLQAPAGTIRTYIDDVTGNVGFGTTAPEARVTSNYSASFAGSDVVAFLGTAENTSSGQAYGGYFNVSSAGTGTHYGVRSEVSAASGTASSYGLFARNNATTASIHYGIVGHATGVGPVQNRALEGVASGATGLNIGVRGSASGTGAYSGRFENATVKVGSAGTENIVDGNGDLYVQDELEVDGLAAFTADVGVGTTTPGSRLHVLEDINSAAVLTIENPNTGTASGERIQFDSEDGSGTGGGAFIAVFDNTSGSTPNGMRIANNLTSGDIDFLTAGSVKMTIDNGGDVGIGMLPLATYRLAVENTGGGAYFNRNGVDGTIIRFDKSGVFVGDISVAAGVVSYNPFTGSHYGWTDEKLERGELVSFTGLNRHHHNDPNSEIIYGIQRSSTPNDPACLGSYLALSEPTQPASSENPHLVMAVGNGDMWVVDESGDIQPGDYLISSSTLGHAMKDDPDKYPLGHVIARAAEPVNWVSESEMVGGQKHKRISVLFESFVRTGTTHLTKVVEQQQREIEELKTAVKALMAKKSSDGNQFGELK